MTLPEDLARLREWTTSEGYAALVANGSARFDARDRAALRRVLASVEDLRDRVALLAPFVCVGCRCAPKTHGSSGCDDCHMTWWPKDDEETAAACLSVGLRALCGRRLW